MSLFYKKYFFIKTKKEKSLTRNLSRKKRRHAYTNTCIVGAVGETRDPPMEALRLVGRVGWYVSFVSHG